MHRSSSVLNAVRVTLNTFLNNADADTNIIIAKTNTMDIDINSNPLQKPSTKRKANEDINPLLNAAKRSKKEVRLVSFLCFFFLVRLSVRSLIAFIEIWRAGK
jgi:hypothetical protein